MSEREPTVLVVDDDRQLADLYSAWLCDEYDVRTAYGGREAIDSMAKQVDVALVDRKMPLLSGDAVLDHVRDEGYDCRVAIVTGIEPDFDIIELGFDEYVVKPVDREDIETVVQSLVTRAQYDKKLQEFFSLACKRAALQAEKEPHELETSDAYAELTAEFEQLQEELEVTVEAMTGRDFEFEMRRVTAD